MRLYKQSYNYLTSPMMVLRGRGGGGGGGGGGGRTGDYGHFFVLMLQPCIISSTTHPC